MSLGITKVHSVVRKAGSLDIHVGSAEDSARLLRCTTFSDIPVTVEPHNTLNFSKGVVQSTEFKFVVAEEMVTISGVQKAEPILISKNGKKVKSGTWILTFNTPVCPEYIDLFWMRIRVNAFIPKPMRCFKCQRFGHKGAKCKSKTDRCIQCGAPEKHENCKKEKKCSNCLEAHSASDKNCKVYKETQQILRHQAENGGTYANSKNILFPSGTTYSKVVKRQSESQKSPKVVKEGSASKLPLIPTPLEEVEETGKGSRKKDQPEKKPEHKKQNSSTDCMEKSTEEMSIEMPSSSETQSTSVCLEPMGRWEDFLSEWKEKKEAGKTASIVKSFKEKKIVNKLQRNERHEKARKLKKKNEIVNKEHAGNACKIVNKNVSNENVESGKLPLTPKPLGKKVEKSGKGS